MSDMSVEVQLLMSDSIYAYFPLSNSSYYGETNLSLKRKFKLEDLGSNQKVLGQIGKLWGRIWN